jgi:hypothetical protein
MALLVGRIMVSILQLIVTYWQIICGMTVV